LAFFETAYVQIWSFKLFWTGNPGSICTSIKMRCDDCFTHAFAALCCIFRVEITKCCSFQPIEKFLLKTQNAAAFKLANVTATQNLGQNEVFQTFDVHFRSL